MRHFLLLSLLSFQLLAASFHFPESKPESKHPFHGAPLPSFFQGSRGKRVALYQDKGVWSLGREHLKLFLKEYGYSYQEVNAVDIRAGILKLGFNLLIMPGGESWQYLASLQEEGANQIREFVKNGGGYFGVCAGAFYAISLRVGGYATGAYGIGLLEGAAFDGTELKVKPYIEGMMNFKLVKNELTENLPEKYSIVMFGGPGLLYSPQEEKLKQIIPISRFVENDQTAMILFQYGKGRVFLSAPHLEVEEPKSDLGPDYEDPDSEWPLLDRVLAKIASR